MLSRRGGGRAPLPSLLVDVLTHPLWVTANGRKEQLLPAGVPLPAAVRRTVTTAQAGQQTASLQFGQGEGAAQVRLGQLVVESLAPSAAGAPALDTVMEADPDGILTAAMTDVSTGQRTFAAVRVGAEALEQDVVLLRMQRGEVRA
jgi:molecular chaperone DnaK (HSP70)